MLPAGPPENPWRVPVRRPCPFCPGTITDGDEACPCCKTRLRPAGPPPETRWPTTPPADDGIRRVSTSKTSGVVRVRLVPTERRPVDVATDIADAAGWPYCAPPVDDDHASRR